MHKIKLEKNKQEESYKTLRRNHDQLHKDVKEIKKSLDEKYQFRERLIEQNQMIRNEVAEYEEKKRTLDTVN